jgi:hypothetical protein
MGIFNLTESEKKNILSLHNNAKVIREQAGETTQQAAPTTQQAAPTTQSLNPIDKIKLIQTTLIDKYKMVLGNTGEKKNGVDGSLGPKTLEAIAKVIKSKTLPDNSVIQSAKINPVVANTPLAANTTKIQPIQIQQGTTSQQLTPKQIRQNKRNIQSQ